MGDAPRRASAHARPETGCQHRVSPFIGYLQPPSEANCQFICARLICAQLINHVLKE